MNAMATKAGVGRSISSSASAAGREAAAQACAPLGDSSPDFCLVFGTSGYDQHDLLEGVRSVTGGARIAGCSAEGIIAGPESHERDRAVAVFAVRSDVFRFEPFLIPGYEREPAAAGIELARQVNASNPRRPLALLLFPDGLTGDCSALLHAAETELSSPIPMIGGAAGDAMVFERTWQYMDGAVASGQLAAVLVSGEGTLVHQVSHGCSTIGLDRTITAAGSGWVREIDGRPAWAVFREFLDGDPQDLNAEGIAHLSLAQALDDDQDYGDFIVRTPLQLERDSGALFFPGGGIAEGTRVKIARRDPERIRESAVRCAERLLASGLGRPDFVLQFDCAGRGRLMFGPCAASEIVQPLQRILGEDVPWAGFHTYGEIAPVAGRSRYHNYTVALCAFFGRGSTA